MSRGLAVAALVLRGMVYRRWLNAGIVVLAMASIAAGTLAPAYLASAITSLRVERLAETPNRLTGLTWTFDPSGSPRTALTDAVAAVSVRSDDGYYAEPRAAALTGPMQSDRFVWTMASPPARCSGLVVTGTCPDEPGQVLVSDQERANGGIQIGDRLRLGPDLVPVVVGTYRLRDPDADRWFDAQRYRSEPAQSDGSGAQQRYEPAPFLAPLSQFAALEATPWQVRVDRVLDPPADTDQQALERIAATASAESNREPLPVRGGTLSASERTELLAIADDVASQERVASRTVLPAVLGLVAVCVLFLYRLIGAAAQARRNELGLLTLRGATRLQVWGQALLEPLVAVVVGAVAGVPFALAANAAMSRTWLRPGTPVGLDAPAWAAAVAVALVALAAVAIGIRRVVTTDLVDQLDPEPPQASTTRRGGWSAPVLASGVLVAAPVAVLRYDLPPAVEQALPLLVGLAAGLLAVGLLAQWTGWRIRRNSTARPWAFLAWRALARRPDGSLLVIPLCLAFVITVFSTSIWLTAASWRQSAAAAEVGAPRSYPANTNAWDALQLTRRIDPDGRYLMAAVAPTFAPNRVALLDTTRIDAVGTWPDQWSPRSIDDIATILAPGAFPTADDGPLSVTIRNDSSSRDDLVLTLSLLEPDGTRQSLFLGPYPQGTHTRTTTVGGCSTRCDVLSVTVGGVAGSRIDLQGTVALRASGSPDSWFDGSTWRLQDGDGAQGVRLRTGAASAVVTFEGDQATTATLVPSTDPVRAPVIAGRTADLQTTDTANGSTLGSAGIPVDLIERTEAVPLVGSTGLLGDLSTFVRKDLDPEVFEGVQILTTADVPAAMLDQLRDQGVAVDDATTLSAARAVLEQDAFALALRLYLVASVAAVVIALTGTAVTLAIQVRPRRRESATLRLAGLRPRTITAAATAELTALLGAAIAGGVTAGILAAQVFSRTVRLGDPDTGDPRPLPVIDVPGLALVTTPAVLVLAATAVSLTTVMIRGSRPITLRQEG